MPSISEAFVLLNKHAPHKTDHGNLIGENTDWFLLALHFPVQTLDGNGCAAATAQTCREHHRGHAAVKAFIRAFHGFFSSVLAVINDGTALSAASSMIFALEILFSSAIRPAWCFSGALPEIFRKKWNWQLCQGTSGNVSLTVFIIPSWKSEVIISRPLSPRSLSPFRKTTQFSTHSFSKT